ncbi:hypothetical protein BOTCAL_0613g00010 [Botryotinia calthae]|uniref:Uncharacterized protein n=1 Tax=Botryotinia calthae TaxID=38488 RepID=A0A4Y8CL98_9HELO|nr:hypothetical protein BOTCAL_0613g00010 [Botryotinia calthae]
MSHHISSFFKSAAGVAENVWESAANNLSNSPKRHRDRRVTVAQAGSQPLQVQQAQQAQQTQPRRLLPAVRPAPIPAASSQSIGLGLGMELSDQSQSSIPRGVENQNPNSKSQSSIMVDTTPTKENTSATTTPPNIIPTSTLTKTPNKNTQRSANSKETSTSKSGNSYNPLVTTSSTYTNPSENLPPTPNLRAVDELGRFADTVAKVGAGSAGEEDSGGKESGGGSASQSQSQGEEISPVDGLGMFGPSPGFGVGSGGAVTHERSEGQGSINMQTPTVTASGSRVHNYRGVDHGPVAIPGLTSGSASGFNTPRLNAAVTSTTGLGTSGVNTQGRERAFTIPRKPVPMTIVVGNTGFEVVPYGRPIEEFSTGACILNRQECMDWKEKFGEQGGDEGEGEGGGEDGEEEEVAGENEEERKERLEKERKEREKRDLLHENPLLSHPVEPTTITTGTPPTVSSIYIAATSLSSKRRGFRRSWTAPINGFNFTSLGGIGVMGFGNTHQDASMHGGLGNAGMGMGQRGSARDRYSGSSSEGIGMGSRRGSFLRRASVSLKGMGMGMQEFLRSASGGGSSAFAGVGAGAGLGGVDHIGEGRNSGIERPATMQSEYRGVRRYAGDEAMAIARERIAEAETQRRRSHRESMVLPKFEWEEEFTNADDEDDA